MRRAVRVGQPERWRPFADVLILGEAERTWPAFIGDFITGAYEDTYRQEERLPLDVSPLPDYGGYSRHAIRSHYAGVVQTSRGCPFDCDFCDAVIFLGRRQRYKPVEGILRELDQLRRMGFRFVVLADDNFSAGRKKAREILRALRDWNVRQRSPALFFTQVSTDTVQDEAFLDLAAEAGLNRVLVGIESPDPDSLREAHKTPNLKRDLAEDVRAFHQHGIVVVGTSILGFDHDTLSSFRAHFDFHMQAGVVNPQPYPLQAPDGTRLKERMLREGRYLDDDGEAWEPGEVNLYNTFSVVPKQMSVEQLKQGTLWLIRELYRPENVVARLARFFEQFEASPKRDKLRIPKQGTDRASLEILGRILRYTVAHADAAERKAVQEVVRLARLSSHPQSYGIGISAFLLMKNVHGILRRIEPDIEDIPCPDGGG